MYLAITCSNNKTDLYIDWETFIGTSNHNVTVRIGDEKAFTKRWLISNDNTTSFYPSSPVAFLKKLSESKIMVARVSPYNDNDLTITFNLSGIDKALQEVRRECKW
ncbi:hypothetical protein DM558_07535 [Entomomonas moraniae]|uniref:Uncharacterized protein n=1 Tax=Entomomonas moraniae TaxID=2213226 RepID=A0A3Q9JJ17_9GAMM|nr:hypothetical protein DM558_07535 [Entomomonas moraniae]